VVDTLAIAAFVVVCCVDDDDDDTVDVDGVADKEGFTVFGIPHMRDSVVLTTFRLGLLGSHIFAFSCGDIVVVLRELAAAAGDDEVGEDDT
jgi:hypothetical protein